MKRHYDQRATVHSFQPAEVLILLPVSGSTLSTKFSGLYVVEKKLSDTNYVIKTPDRRRLSRMCHVNMIEQYCSNRNGSSTAQDVQIAVSPVSSLDSDDELVMHSATPQGARLSNAKILSDLSHHHTSVEKLIRDFPGLFNDVPSQSSVIAHDIVLTKPVPIKQHSYWVNPTKREIMKKRG